MPQQTLFGGPVAEPKQSLDGQADVPVKDLSTSTDKTSAQPAASSTTAATTSSQQPLFGNRGVGAVKQTGHLVDPAKQRESLIRGVKQKKSTTLMFVFI